MSDAWSGPDGHSPGEGAVHRRGAGWGAPSGDRSGGSGEHDVRRRQGRGGAQYGGSGRQARPHERRRTGLREVEKTPPYRLAPGATAPRRAREVVASRFHDHLDEDRLEDAMLLVSELVTNSVVHAGLDVDGWIDLTLTLRAEAVRVEVADSGHGFGAGDQGLPAPERIGGRGLFLVRALADRCDVAPEGTSRVWFELDR
ncbi:MAG: hypothetical protein QOK40_832 [Miltoncostaeaceae bacterium]|nr:hypothetical protein [Miltoncostaeaceae bacterium]